jgi:hypothetical protein
MQKLELNDFELINCETVLEIEDKNDEELPLQEKSLRKRLAQPGLFGLHCLTTSFTVLESIFDVYFSMQSMTVKLMYDTFESSNILGEDFRRFYFSDFVFIFFALGPEWKDREKMEKEYSRIKNLWSYPFYNDSV